MRKFLLKAVIFMGGLFAIILFFVVAPSKNELFNTFIGKISNSSEYSRYVSDGGTASIIKMIDRAQESGSHTKLVLGDSVCYRLFRGLDETNDEYLMIGTNQAVGVTGQYLLADQFIENHENVTDIYLVMVCNSWRTDFGL